MELRNSYLAMAQKQLVLPGKAMKKKAMKKGKKNGRPANSRYTAAQLGLIHEAVSRGLGYKAILKAYPHSGLSLYGVKTAAARIKKSGDVGRQVGSGRLPTKCSGKNAKKVQVILSGNPGASIRSICKGLGLKRGTVANILKKKLGKKCLKKVKAQKLTQQHPQRRLQARRAWVERMASGALDHREIFFTDEKIFRVGSEGHQNTQNFRIWADEGAKKRDVAAEDIVLPKSQGGASVMCALGACYNGLGQLMFAEKGVKINKEVYLELIKGNCEPDMHMLLPEGAVFMQDGASSHTAKVVTAYLETKEFDTLAPWPANSPDLPPMDYGIWGILQKRVAEASPRTEVELKVAIRRAVASLPLETIRATIDDFPKRLAMCIEAAGKQFEYKK